jgi:hypothetical protein
MGCCSRKRSALFFNVRFKKPSVPDKPGALHSLQLYYDELTSLTAVGRPGPKQSTRRLSRSLFSSGSQQRPVGSNFSSSVLWLGYRIWCHRNSTIQLGSACEYSMAGSPNRGSSCGVLLWYTMREHTHLPSVFPSIGKGMLFSTGSVPLLTVPVSWPFSCPLI